MVAMHKLREGDDNGKRKSVYFALLKETFAVLLSLMPLSSRSPAIRASIAFKS